MNAFKSHVMVVHGKVEVSWELINTNGDIVSSGGAPYKSTFGDCNTDLNNQQLFLPNGWSMFSTYVSPTNSNFTSVIAPINDEIVIAKDYLGNAYLAEWGFNGIGNIDDGQGYQIKIDNGTTSNSPVQLSISGSYLEPENTPIQLESGWNMIGYLRTDEVSAISILSEINDSGNLVIAKDYLGGAYLPEWGFNGIGFNATRKGVSS